MPKQVDNRYRINALRFLCLYNSLKKHVLPSDLAYLFKNHSDYDIDHIVFTKKKYKKQAIELMSIYNILLEYLDDESISNLEMLGGQL